MMLLKNVVVKILDARERLALFRTWHYFSDNVTSNYLISLNLGALPIKQGSWPYLPRSFVRQC